MKLSLANTKKKLYLGVARYFRFWAERSLRRWKPRVIAVTGSVGKTTLLNLLEVQLGNRAHYSHDANSAYGIAFDILGMKGVTGSKLKWIYLFTTAPVRALWFTRQQPFYIVEIDGERPRETQFLAEWLRPEVTLWVSVGRTHAVYFDAQVKQGLFETVEEAIVHEFAFLPKNTSKLVIYDDDNKLMRKTMQTITGPDVVKVDDKALERYEAWPNRTEITVDGHAYEFAHPLPSEVYVQLAILGKLATYLDEDPVSDLTTYIQPPGRSNYYQGRNGVNLIDSSYNAHLISMESVIHLFSGMHAKHKWIVIGDMVEQGVGEADQHGKLGKILKAAGFERYVLVGRRTQTYTLPELDPTKTVSFLHPKDAAIYLDSHLKGGETVLFKGSQYLEGVVEYLLEDREQAKTLPRQNAAAKKRRAKWGLV